MTARRSHLGARSSDLLDGRLCAAEETAVRRHLASCRDCAELVRAERDVRAALRGLAALAGPAPVTPFEPAQHRCELDQLTRGAVYDRDHLLIRARAPSSAPRQMPAA